jgi:hypothetical protein
MAGSLLVRRGWHDVRIRRTDVGNRGTTAVCEGNVIDHDFYERFDKQDLLESSLLDHDVYEYKGPGWYFGDHNVVLVVEKGARYYMWMWDTPCVDPREDLADVIALPIRQDFEMPLELVLDDQEKELVKTVLKSSGALKKYLAGELYCCDHDCDL